MSQTLYRKYRSQTFGELVGQQHVTRVLRNAIARDRVGHAYLFCGPRGTGKTSVARIFAKALNCLERQDADCCDRCEHCSSITSGNAVDVIEIDAASKNKVDDVRDLRDKVGYAPLRFHYKIYIIDEVHMITTQGFNALLKTLEEPPANVVFILCTTEAHKLPLTILSRCTRFDFQRLPRPELAQHLVWMAQQEGFELEPAAALALADLADGSARDAVSLLDQLTVYCEQQITSRDVQELFQLGDPALPGQVVDTMAAGDSAALLAVWENLMEQGADAGRFLLQVAGELRQRCLADNATPWRAALDAVWQGLNLLKFENFPALLVELTLLKAQQALETSGSQALPATAASNRKTAQPLPAAEPHRTVPQPAPRVAAPAVSPPPVHQREAVKPPVTAPALAPEPVPVPRPAAVQPAATTPQPEPEWERFLEAVKRRRLTTYSLLVRDAAGEYANQQLTISFDMRLDKRIKQPYGFARLPENAAILREAAVEVFGAGTKVELRLLGEATETTLLEGSARKGTPDGRAASESTAMPIELLADVTPDLPEAKAPGRVRPDSMSQEAEDMHRDLSEKRQAEPVEEKPATVNDVMDLFGGTLIGEED